MNDVMYLDEALDYLNGITPRDFIATYESYFMNLQEESKLFSEFDIVNEGVGDNIKKALDKFKQWVINCIQKVKNFGKKVAIKITNTIIKVLGNNYEKKINAGEVSGKVKGRSKAILLDTINKSKNISNEVTDVLNLGALVDINSDAETKISESENNYKELKEAYDKDEIKEYEFSTPDAKVSIKSITDVANNINQSIDVITKSYDKTLKDVERWLNSGGDANSAEKIDSKRQNLIGIATKAINLSMSSLMLLSKASLELLNLIRQAAKKQNKEEEK